MSLIANNKNFQKLRYGFNAKIFINQIFTPVSIYLDTLYDNFLWITTDNRSFLVDLCFSQISSYSLEIQLAIKYQSGYQGQFLPRYILLKELNTEIPIIFEQFQKVQRSSEQDIGSFYNGRKPGLYDLIQKYIDEKKSTLQYSSNFSRLFKKMRILMQDIQRSKPTQFKSEDLIILFNKIQQIKSVDKKQFVQKNKTFNTEQAVQKLKILYCRQNIKFLKSLSQTNQQPINNFKRPQDFLQQKVIQLGYNQYPKTCFQILTSLQNAQNNYIIINHIPTQDLCLVDYFCFSSHNTYLTGNQLTSDSKITRYIEDLKKGIKCVQLDVHNQGGNEPIITHAISGKGFCKEISFRKTIQSIDQYLEYHPNHYPIILSIQNHANRQNQDLMNNILVKEFPRCILTPKGKEQFPRLSQCKGKIIVKTSCDLETLSQFKNNQQAPKTSKLYKGYSKQLSQFEQETRMHANQFSFSSKNQSKLYNKQHIQASQIYNNNINIQPQNSDYKAFLDKIKKVKKLKQLFNQKIDQTSYLPVQKIVQITCMFKAPKGIQTPKPSSFECTSMINTKIVKTQKDKIINYTKQAWLRSYPQGTEIHSKNYEFLDLLARGVQIIALNTQTNDDHAIMMNSYFRAGRTNQMQTLGYIQKPEYLRRSNYSKISQVIPFKRQYTFTFYTHLNLQFSLYSLDKVTPNIISTSDYEKKVKFNLEYYNESFLIIRIADKKYIESIPLRFLPYHQNGPVYKTLIGRDYQFEDTGIRILMRFEHRQGRI